MRKRKRDAVEMLPHILRSVREAVGGTQVDLADKLGISRQLIAQWETGRVTPNTQQLEEWLAWIVTRIGFLQSYNIDIRTFFDSLSRDWESIPETTGKRNRFMLSYFSRVGDETGSHLGEVRNEQVENSSTEKVE